MSQDIYAYVLGMVGILPFLFYKKVGFVFAIFLSSYIYTPVYNINVALFLFFCIISFLASFHLPAKNRTFHIFVFLISLVFFSLSTVFTNSNLILSFGKGVKILLVFLIPLAFVSFLSLRDFRQVLIVFIFSSLLVGGVKIPLSIYDQGFFLTPRFEGFFNDANYFSIICVMFVLLIDNMKNVFGFSSVRKSLIFLSFLSQSLTINLFLIFYLLFRERTFFSLKKSQMIFFPILIGIGWVIFIVSLFWMVGEISFREDYLINPVSYKINSVLFRLDAQFKAVSILMGDPKIWLMGYGSGHSLELFGRVFHNTYFQILFDNGLFVFLFFFLMVGYFNYLFKLTGWPILFFSFVSLNFDPYFMYVYSFFLFLAKTIDKKSEETIQKQAVFSKSFRISKASR